MIIAILLDKCYEWLVLMEIVMNKFVGNMLDTPNQYMCYMKLGTSNSFCVPIYIYMSVISLFFIFLPINISVVI